MATTHLTHGSSHVGHGVQTMVTGCLRVGRGAGDGLVQVGQMATCLYHAAGDVVTVGRGVADLAYGVGETAWDVGQVGYGIGIGTVAVGAATYSTTRWAIRGVKYLTGMDHTARTFDRVETYVSLAAPRSRPLSPLQKPFADHQVVDEYDSA